MRHQKEMTFQLHYQNGDLENGAGLKSPAKSPNQEQGNDELAHELQKLGLGFLGNTFLWLRWVFVAARAFLQLQGLGAALQLRCAGLSLQRLPLVQSMGSRPRSLQQLRFLASRSQAQWSWRLGLAALWHMGSSRTRDQSHVSCIGRQVLYH